MIVKEFQYVPSVFPTYQYSAYISSSGSGSTADTYTIAGTVTSTGWGSSSNSVSSSQQNSADSNGGSTYGVTQGFTADGNNGVGGSFHNEIGFTAGTTSGFVGTDFVFQSSWSSSDTNGGSGGGFSTTYTDTGQYVSWNTCTSNVTVAGSTTVSTTSQFSAITSTSSSSSQKAYGTDGSSTYELSWTYPTTTNTTFQANWYSWVSTVFTYSTLTISSTTEQYNPNIPLSDCTLLVAESNDWAWLYTNSDGTFASSLSAISAVMQSFTTTILFPQIIKQTVDYTQVNVTDTFNTQSATWGGNNITYNVLSWISSSASTVYQEGQLPMSSYTVGVDVYTITTSSVYDGGYTNAYSWDAYAVSTVNSTAYLVGTATTILIVNSTATSQVTTTVDSSTSFQNAIFTEYIVFTDSNSTAGGTTNPNLVINIANAAQTQAGSTAEITSWLRYSMNSQAMSMMVLYQMHSNGFMAPPSVAGSDVVYQGISVGGNSIPYFWNFTNVDDYAACIMGGSTYSYAYYDSTYAFSWSGASFTVTLACTSTTSAQTWADQVIGISTVSPLYIFNGATIYGGCPQNRTGGETIFYAIGGFEYYQGTSSSSLIYNANQSSSVPGQPGTSAPVAIIGVPAVQFGLGGSAFIDLVFPLFPDLT